MRFIIRHYKRLKNTFIWSWQGWLACWRDEISLRQWFLANCLSAALAMSLDFTGLERAVIIGFGLMILVAELLNSAVETVVDMITTDPHPLAKKAKDAGSAAVAVAAITAGLVWLFLGLG